MQTETNELEYPKYATIWAALIYVLCAATLAYPALAGQFLVNPHSDQYIAGFPFRDFAAQSLRAGEGFPQWNPYLFGGMPFIAAMHGDIFYPTFLLRMIMPTDVAMTWSFIIHLVLAGLFTFIFLRSLKFRFYGSLLGGIAYMMSGQVASLVSPGHDGKLYVSALFPILLWCLVKGIRDAKGWCGAWVWGLLAIVVGLDVLSPHPQLLQYSLLAAGAYAIFLAVKLDKGSAVRRLGLALGSVILGGLMGAIQYLPVREYVAWSPRAGGIGNYETATSYGWNPEEILNIYLPQFTGMLDKYWGPNGIHLHSEYIGVVVLLLAGAAFIGLRTDTRKKEIWFWAITLIVATLWSLGAHTPFYHIPYAIIPGTKFFRAPATIFFVGSIAISFLVAVGAEKVLNKKVGKTYLTFWLLFGGLIAILGVTGGLTSLARNIAPEQLLDLVDSNQSDLLWGSVRSLTFLILAVMLVFLCYSGKMQAKFVAWGMALLMIADLWSVERHYWLFSAPAAQLYASNEAIDIIKNEKQPVRVLTLQTVRGTGSSPNLNGSGLMDHGIRNVTGYHGNQLGRYNMLAGKEEGFVQPVLMDPNLRRLLNLKYFMIDVPDLEKQMPGLVKRIGPVTEASGNQVYLYEVPGPNPYAWVVPLIVKAPDTTTYVTLRNPQFDVTRAAIFDTSAKVTAQTNVTALPEPLPITVTASDYKPGSVTLNLSQPAPKGSALLVSENYYPGWTATVDGKPAVIDRADLSLIGVEMPEGAKTVQLKFDNAKYETGKMITLVAFGFALLALLGGAIGSFKKRNV